MLLITSSLLLLLRLDPATGNTRLAGHSRRTNSENTEANISFDPSIGGQQRRGLSSPQVRVFGGWDSVEDRYAYAQVRLESTVDGFECGGSLVAPDIVLTAAHCSGTFDKIIIGKHSLDDASDASQTFGVAQLIVHPSYDDVLTRFDAMLVLLDGSSALAEPVRINSDSLVPENGQSLTVVGWGYDQNWQLPDVLQETQVTYTRNLDCINLQGDDGVTLKGNLYDDMMCAGDVGRDSCYGDSGSPLILSGDSAATDVVVGVVSWGLQCAGDLPGIYSRISNEPIYDFIEKSVCELSVEPPSYMACYRWTETQPSDQPSQAPSASPSHEPSPFPTEPPVEGINPSSAAPSSTQLREFFQGTNATSPPTSDVDSSGAESSSGTAMRLLSRHARSFSILTIILYCLV